MTRTLSVIIPTYQRPGWIKRAVRSLSRQTRIPDEVVPIARDTDVATHASIAELQTEGLPFQLRMVQVSEPGFMPPVEQGFRTAEGEIVAVLDDDAEALEDWAERLIGHYDRPDIGAVGGRYINMLPDERVDTSVGTASRVGYISAFGRVEGNLYKNPTFDEHVDVSFLIGGCMSFRRDIARRLEFDWELNRVVATHYEVDLCLQVRNLGYRVVFDPGIAVRHYTAPRAVVGNRKPNDAEAVRWNCYNETRILLRRMPPWIGAFALARGLVLGYRRSPGALPWVFGPLARRAGYALDVAPAALGGRIAAARALLRTRDAGRRP